MTNDDSFLNTEICVNDESSQIEVNDEMNDSDSSEVSGLVT